MSTGDESVLKSKGRSGLRFDQLRVLSAVQSAARQRLASSLGALMLAKAYGVTTLREPGLLLGRVNYVLLLSHGRSYSSLLSHILGSHPEIVGSSETFDSYVRSRDLVRLKYKTYWFNAHKNRCRYVFDKVLNNFPISRKILNRDDVHVIFTLRKPVKTIRSMVKSHRDVGSENEFWEKCEDAAKACELYVRRLNGLERHCLDLNRKAIYFDSEDLVERTDVIFDGLKSYLNLSQDLSQEYQTFGHTGVNGGDHSPRIRLGKINRNDSDYSNIVIPESVLETAQQAYDRCRSILRDRCTCP